MVVALVIIQVLAEVEEVLGILIWVSRMDRCQEGRMVAMQLQGLGIGEQMLVGVVLAAAELVVVKSQLSLLDQIQLL